MRTTGAEDVQDVVFISLQHKAQHVACFRWAASAANTMGVPLKFGEQNDSETGLLQT